MTQQDQTFRPPQTSAVGAPGNGSPGGAIQQASDAAGDVADTAREGLQSTAATAKDQAASVVHEVKGQVSELSRRTADEFRQQADARGREAAQALHDMARQVGALASGRPQEAAQLRRYLDEGQEKLEAFANRLEQRGPQGIVDDVSMWARRHPGMFLAASVGAGFLVGRMVRAGAGTDGAPPSSSTGWSPTAPPRLARSAASPGIPQPATAPTYGSAPPTYGSAPTGGREWGP